MSRQIIHTDRAPAAIGTYNQAVKVGNTTYLSGQIPLVPETMEMVSEDFSEQAHQVFKNLSAVCEAAGGTLNDMAQVNIFVIDLGHFATVNSIMAEYFSEPYPARAAVQVAALPKGAQIEIDGMLITE